MPSRRYPPGPRGLPLIGNARAFQTGMMPFLRAAVQEYGDFIHLPVVNRHVYVVNSPSLMREILVQRWTEFTKSVPGRPPLGLGRYLGKGLLTNDGAAWQRQRKLMQPAMHMTQVRSYATTMATATLGMLHGWKPDSVRDVATDLMHLTMQIASKTLFGSDVGTDPAVDQALVNLQRLGLQEASAIVSLPDWMPTRLNRQRRMVNRVIDTFVARILAERRAASTAPPHDLLAMLMDARYDDGSRMSDQQIRDEVITLFVAGHETTANTLSWLFICLSQNHDVEGRLHEELDRVLGGRVPSAEDMPRLPYLKQVVQETLRMYPVAHLFPRVAAQDTELDGYALRRGDTVLMSPYIFHHDPRYWPDPARFNPERFAPDNEAGIDKTVYMPFGGGPRVCIGNIFALMETQLLTAIIAQQYRLELIPGETPTPEYLVTTRPRDGLRMRVRRR